MRQATSGSSKWGRGAVPVRALIASIVTTGLGLPSCSRHADLLDEPDSFQFIPRPQPEAGDIPAVDSGLGSDAFAVCADRGSGNCRGPVDFPCDFDNWVTTTIVRCQEATGCKANGYVRVRLGSEGCVDEIGMDKPSDGIIACLVSAFGAVKCPCTTIETKYFLGIANGDDASMSVDGSYCAGPHG